MPGQAVPVVARGWLGRSGASLAGLEARWPAQQRRGVECDCLKIVTSVATWQAFARVSLCVCARAHAPAYCAGFGHFFETNTETSHTHHTSHSTPARLADLRLCLPVSLPACPPTYTLRCALQS